MEIRGVWTPKVPYNRIAKQLLKDAKRESSKKRRAASKSEIGEVRKKASAANKG